MSAPVRVLLVGAGRMGLGHLRAIREMPELGEVVAGVDPSAEARARLREEFGVGRVYAGLEEALEKEAVDAAFVCSPNFLHAQYALRVLEAGAHVFVEKPMALNLQDVDAMVRVAGERGRLLMSGQTLRFVAPLRYVKKLIDGGAIGRVRHVVHRRMGSSRGGDEQSWFARQALSGGILPGIGTHSLDVLLWWLGERARRVYAVVQNIDPHPEVDIEDEVSLVAECGSGAILNVALSFHHRVGTEWIAAGTGGVIQLAENRGEVLVNGEKQEVPEWVELPGAARIQQEFFSAIREGRPLQQASGAEVRSSMALIFAAQESGRTGRAVDVG